MPVNGLVFETRGPVVRSAPNRADIACFVGFVGRRPGPLPALLLRALAEQGWTSPPYARPIDELLDVPVAIDTWEIFDRLFAWDRRDLDGRGGLGTSYLGAAVRSFFVQGGRKCYVVRVGDPGPLTEPRSQRLLRLPALLPGYPVRFDPSPADRLAWRGLGHLFGLPDVSFVCLPDLADLVAADRAAIEPLPSPPPAREQFVECSEPEPAPPADRLARRLRAPRADGAGYAAWARAVRLAADTLARFQREVQLVAAVPLPEVESDADHDLLRFLSDSGWLAGRRDLDLASVASAFVQLAYPWARTPGSADLAEQLEPPDGVLAGVLARSALTRGAFRSAAGVHLADVYDVVPSLSREQLTAPTAGLDLSDRVSLLGPTPGGLRLLSDVTTAADPWYRLAPVNRLVSVIVRAARTLGEDSAFEPSSEQTWADVRGRLGELLRALFQAGALQGATAAEAFQVRCDRSTMSQTDIDDGRVIAEVEFQAAAPVERLTVVLALDEGGAVSLASPRPTAESPA
jgi:hypothetical protein